VGIQPGGGQKEQEGDLGQKGRSPKPGPQLGGLKKGGLRDSGDAREETNMFGFCFCFCLLEETNMNVSAW
jgi:hypothetical protein